MFFVAPSFQDMERVSEPYLKNNKYYLDVKNQKTGKIRSVRAYSESEYAKAYGAAAKKKLNKDDGFDNLREVRGFGDGPILVVRNNTDDDEPWLIDSPARYAMGIRWYFTSNCEIPLNTPLHFKFLLLTWEEASLDDRHMKPQEELKKILDKKARNGEWVKF